MGNKTQEKYKRAKELIPGGVQLLSKSPEQFAPGQWPGYFAKAKGCEVWDLDGNHYYDMTTNGIGACMLGFADPDVSAAVIRRVENGSMCTCLLYTSPPPSASAICHAHTAAAPG